MKLLYNRTAAFNLSPTNCLILCFQRSLKAQCIKPLTKTLCMFLYLFADWFVSNHCFLLNCSPIFPKVLFLEWKHQKSMNLTFLTLSSVIRFFFYMSICITRTQYLNWFYTHTHTHHIFLKYINLEMCVWVCGVCGVCVYIYINLVLAGSCQKWSAS